MESRWGNPDRHGKAGRAPIFRTVMSAALTASAALMSAGLLAGCMGGSDGIENPKVELEFRGPDGTSQGNGEVRVYARFMNPVEDDSPMLTKTFNGKAEFTLQPEDLDAVLKAGLGGTLKDTVLEFNVMAVAGDREAFLGGFHYKRQGSKVSFALGAWDKPGLDFGAIKRTVNLLAAVRDFKGSMGANGVSYGIDYVYIPGSPYHANVNSADGATTKRGEFLFSRMGQGSYELFGADKDSATFYKSGDTLSTQDTAYSAKVWDPITIIDR